MRAWWVSCVLGLVLGGCAALAPPPELKEPLFADALFARSTVRVDADQVFQATPEMRRYVQEQILPAARRYGVVQAMSDALYTRGQLALEYDSARTRTASEAFEAHSGNCLSLVIMTAALAREAGLEVHFQQVYTDEAWDHSGDLFLFIGHVNLSIGPRFGGAWVGGQGGWVTIDFLPGRDLKRQRTAAVDEKRIVAMFANNRAAEALAAARYDEAYAWAKAAVQQDRRFWTAYNTLGVIYQRRGAYAQSEAVFRSALAAEPENVHVMGNLVLALRNQGRAPEAAVLEAELRRLQPLPPFALFRQGRQALREGNYRRAADLFERELDGGPDYHEFHFWLALALINLGDSRGAREHLEKALENSTTREQSALYAAKLHKLELARERSKLQ